MEPVTHLLTGACMGRAGFNRKSALATMTMVLAAEAADLDIVWGLKGSIAELQRHRGITHSFVGVPFVAAFTLGFVYLWWRCRDRMPWSRRHGLPPQVLPDAQSSSATLGSSLRRKEPPVRWGYLYFLAVLAALSHLLLDYTTAYGVRLMEPFNYRWYSWDIVFIVEPLMLLALIAGLVLPSLFGLVNEEIGAREKEPRGRAGAIFALVCLVIIWGYRDYQHRRALNALDAITYHGAEPLRVAAYPYWINPFHWYGVVETRDFFQTVQVDSLSPDVEQETNSRTYYKPEDTLVSLAAKSSYMGHVFLDWAVFPYLETNQLEGDLKGHLVEFQDLRYAYPDLRGGRGLTGFVLLSPDLRVLDEGMNNKNSPTIESLENAQPAP